MQSVRFLPYLIRSWLGYANLDTTNHYAQASTETKRKALEQVDSKLHSAKPPRWKRDADLLVWLGVEVRQRPRAVFAGTDGGTDRLQIAEAGSIFKRSPTFLLDIPG